MFVYLPLLTKHCCVWQHGEQRGRSERKETHSDCYQRNTRNLINNLMASCFMGLSLCNSYDTILHAGRRKNEIQTIDKALQEKVSQQFEIHCFSNQVLSET